MLIAVFLFFATLLGGTDSLAERLDEVLTEPERRDQALGVVEQLQAAEAKWAASLEQATASLAEIHRDHAATTEDYQEFFEQFDAEWGAAMDSLLEARGELRDLTTADEWTGLFGAE